MSGSVAEPSAPRQRLHGLDTLRCVAIVLVLAYHTMVFVTGEATFGWVSRVGWIGVDLFFVLSGYLIANQLLAAMQSGRRLSLPVFYGRRLMRTLPNFYAVLALYWLFPAQMGGKAPPPWWRFLSFTQNIGLVPGTAFSHAWSLCIEEQFYLVLPAAILVGAAMGRLGRGRMWMAWALLGALVVGGMAVRSALWDMYGQGRVIDYYRLVYYGTPTRLDEFLPGVALALWRHAHPACWSRLARHGQGLLCAGVVASAVMAWLVLTAFETDGGYRHAMTAYGYSLIAMAFALLVAAALSPTSWLHRCRVPGAETLATWSFAIYLTHKPIAFALQRALPPLPNGVLLPVLATACLAGGWLLHRVVEQPFLALRDRWWPSNVPRHHAPRDLTDDLD